MIKTFIPKKAELGVLNLHLTDEGDFQFITGFDFVDKVSNATYSVSLPREYPYWDEVEQDVQEVCDRFSILQWKAEACELLSFLTEKEEIQDFNDVLSFFRYDELQYWGRYENPAEAGVAMFCDQLKKTGGVIEYLNCRDVFYLADGFMDWEKFYNKCKDCYKGFKGKEIYVQFKEGVPDV